MSNHFSTVICDALRATIDQNFESGLAVHLASELDIDPEIIISAYKTFKAPVAKKASEIPVKPTKGKKTPPPVKDEDDTPEEEQVKPSKKKPAPVAEEDDDAPVVDVKKGKKKPTPVVEEDNEAEDNTCFWDIKSKAGERKCAKESSEVIEENHYCTTHAKSVHTRIEKEKADAKSKKGKKSTSKDADKDGAKEAISSKLMKTPAKVKSVEIKQIGKFHVEPVTRIIFSKDTKNALGILDKDNKTVKGLTDENIRFVEKHGMVVDPKAKLESSKSSKKKVEPLNDEDVENSDAEVTLDDDDVADNDEEETVEAEPEEDDEVAEDDE